MQSVEEWKKNKGTPKSSKIQSVSDFLKTNPGTEKAKNLATLAQREQNIAQGKPVSIFKSRLEPNIVEKMVSGIAKPFEDVATNLINAGHIAVGAKETKPLSNKYQGEVKGLGKVDLTKSPWEKENLKTIIKSASTGAEIASYLNAAGVAEKTVAGLTAKGVLANKATFAEWAVKNIPSLAKEGALQGIAYTAGSQGREYADTGKPFSAKQAVTDVALSTAGNVIIPTALRKVFSGDAKINAARLAEQKAKEAISPATKVDDIVESGLTNKGVIDTPSQPGVVKTPTKPITPTQGTPIIKEIPEEIITKDTSSLANDLPEGLDYGNFNTWSKEVRGIHGVDANEAINVAMGGQKKIKNEIPPNAYLSIMKNVAEETGDIKLAQKLANSNVASKSGQNLVASKMAQHGNVTDILRDVKVSFLKKKGITPERFVTEQTSLLTKVKQQFKEIDDAIINSLLCK